MIRLAIVGTLAAQLLTTPAHSQAMSRGAGSISCSEVENVLAVKEMRDIIYHWALGYMTGYNVERIVTNAETYADLTTAEPEFIFDHIRAACARDKNVSLAMGMGYARDALPTALVND